MNNPAPSSNQLHSLSITYQSFEASPPPGKGFVATWTNNLGYPIFVVGVEVWIGEQGGAITDTPFSMINVTSGDILLSRGWDHYAAPTGIDDNTAVAYWAPYWYLVAPNEVIQFSVAAASYTGPEAVAAGAMLRYLQ